MCDIETSIDSDEENVIVAKETPAVTLEAVESSTNLLQDAHEMQSEGCIPTAEKLEVPHDMEYFGKGKWASDNTLNDDISTASMDLKMSSCDTSDVKFCDASDAVLTVTNTLNSGVEKSELALGFSPLHSTEIHVPTSKKFDEIAVPGPVIAQLAVFGIDYCLVTRVVVPKPLSPYLADIGIDLDQSRGIIKVPKAMLATLAEFGISTEQVARFIVPKPMLSYLTEVEVTSSGVDSKPIFPFLNDQTSTIRSSFVVDSPRLSRLKDIRHTKMQNQNADAGPSMPYLKELGTRSTRSQCMVVTPRPALPFLQDIRRNATERSFKAIPNGYNPSPALPYLQEIRRHATERGLKAIPNGIFN